MLELEIISIKHYSDVYFVIKGTRIPIGCSDYSSDEIEFYFPRHDLNKPIRIGELSWKLFFVRIPLFGESRKKAIPACRDEVQQLLNKELEDAENRRMLVSEIFDGDMVLTC